MRAAEASMRELRFARYVKIAGAISLNLTLLTLLGFWSAKSNSWIFASSLWVTFLIENTLVSPLAAARALKSLLTIYLGGGFVNTIVAISLYGAVLPRNDVNPIARGVIFATYLNTVVPLGALGLGIAMSLTARAVVDSLRLRRYPGVVVFAELQVLTKTLGSDKQSLSKMNLQNEMNGRLERAAICLQKGIGRSFFLSSPNKSTFQLRLDRAAARFREYQLWIALPGCDTRADLFSEIAQTCADFSAGLYDFLPESDAPALGARDYVSNFVRAFRGLAAGVFPLFTLWSVRRFGLMPEDTLGSSLTVAAIIWAVVSIVGLIDPLCSGKIAALKDVMSILTRGGK
ncbi:hypothetical protein [Streptomyces sp. NPDC051572]|uniref:hypothetical protein n=1 Tax=unclassified Streptomyces TaxID=2593676 RepID=UPI00344F60F2